jgi:hypothetical protein
MRDHIGWFNIGRLGGIIYRLLSESPVGVVAGGKSS